MFEIKQLFIGLFGIIGILWGGQIIVINAKSIARTLKISEFFIGLTILSIGTSLPEIFTHIMSSIKILMQHEAIQTLSGIAVGTNIGSNIIQITFITGLSGCIAVIYTSKEFLKRDYIIMLFSILLLWIFTLNNYISQFEGVVLVLFYLGYMYYLYQHEKINEKIDNNHKNGVKNGIKIKLAKISLGLVFLIICANYILDVAVYTTEYFNISGSLIGTLIIGVCTALPEFTTSVIGLLKKSSGLSLGTLVGSNITNPTLALGIGAAISGYRIDNVIVWFDIPFWFIVSFIILFFFWRDLKLYRSEGVFLVGFYIAFVVLRIFVV